MRTVKTLPAAEKITGALRPGREEAPPAARETRQAAGAAGGALRRVGFLVGLVVLVHALASLADTAAPDWNTRFLQADRRHAAAILAGAERIDALAVGNSHAGALRMADLGYADGYRFARADGDLFETSHIIRSLTPRLPQVEAVFLPVSYFTFLEENTAADEVSIRRAHMYAALPGWSFLPGDLSPFLNGKSQVYLPVLRLVREDNWEGVFRALLGQPQAQKGFIEVADGDCSSLSPDQLAASAENRVAKYMRLTGAARSSRPEIAEDAYAALADTARFLGERGVRLVLFTPPYWQGYTDLYRQKDGRAVLLTEATMRRAQAELGVEYYDFSRHPDFAPRAELFKDSDHLNSCGAAQFSRVFSRQMDRSQAGRP